MLFIEKWMCAVYILSSFYSLNQWWDRTQILWQWASRMASWTHDGLSCRRWYQQYMCRGFCHGSHLLSPTPPYTACCSVWSKDKNISSAFVPLFTHWFVFQDEYWCSCFLLVEWALTIRKHIFLLIRTASTFTQRWEQEALSYIMNSGLVVPCGTATLFQKWAYKPSTWLQ